MPRSTPYSALFAALVLGALGSACGDDTVTNPDTGQTPVSVTESYTDTITVNGAHTTPFTVNRAGTVSARLSALAPDDTVTIGLSLGTWNGSSCQIILANDSAVLNAAVTGTAQQTGQFCVRIYDVGKLTAATDYTIDITHF
jgi:hypothetical protein